MIDLTSRRSFSTYKKSRNTCERYSKIRVYYKYRTIFETVSNNCRILIMKQDKLTAFALMNRTVYLEKCLDILDNNQFTSLGTTTKTGKKIQQFLRKIRINLAMQEYSTIYPTGSCPGTFYGTAKVLKLPENRNVDQLLLDQLFLIQELPLTNWQNI